MASIPTQSRTASEVAVSKLDLNSGPHSFAYNRVGQVLHIDNGEAGNLTVNISGDGVTNVPVRGLEDQTLTSGYDIVVPTLEQRPVLTSDRDKYLGNTGNNVVVTVTGATGLSFAWITTQS